MKYIFFCALWATLPILIISSCTKNNLREKEKNYNLTRSTAVEAGVNNQSARLISTILTDEIFVKICETLRIGTVLNTTSPSRLDGKALHNFLQEKRTVTRTEDAQAVFEKYGVPNSTELFSNFNKLPFLAASLFSKNAAFNNLSKEEATGLLQGSMQAYFNEHPITYRELLNGDQCSQAYAVGMTGCHNQFIIEVGVILAGTGITIIFTGGIGAAITLSMSTLMAGAYAHLYSCQQGVAANWRICRENNPTHKSISIPKKFR
ncbi:MAG: hypothetical protein ACKOD1_00725, partial [Sphingomonadales bacterium]